ncbi:hypothetical protein [Sulfuricurvum sp.]|uniref:hypothetical protein n=1 Tax=Sulfuricurvum sp. TaxID=2025608 RepID=UPI002612632F|nr:hypothetical protein [Sulfuricurvum sp.]MDD4949248.1 hypothetical protein [Sulfuricurvum sp.]
MRQADLASTDTIAVGTGADELILTGTGSVVDADFTLVSGLEKVTLSDTGAASVVMGELGKTAGVRTINASASTAASSVDLSSMTTADVAMSITTGTGNDLVKMKAGYLTSADTINGGTNTTVDTLEIIGTGSIVIADADLTNVSGIETLKLTSSATTATNTITFAEEAKGAGITTIDASGIVQGGNITTFDFSTATTNGGYTIKGGAGADTIKMNAGDLTSADTIIGNSGSDLLEFTTAINSTDSTILAHVDVEKIKLHAGDDQKLTLNAYGSALEIDAVTNLTTDKVTVDATLMTNNLKLTTSGGADTVTLGQGVDTIVLGSGADTVKTLSGRLTSTDNINFGVGADILEFTNAATVDDTMFTNVNGLEKIVLANGANTVVLGDLARSAGINTIDGAASTSALNLTLNMGSDISLGATVTGGSAADTIIMAASQLSTDDHIDGGLGNDTIWLTGTGILKDDVFAALTSIKTLKLDNQNQDFTLGSNAATAGIDTIDTSVISGTTQIKLDVSAMTTNMSIDLSAASGADTIVMGQAVDTIKTGGGNDTIRVAGDKLTSADTIDGGTGTDVLEFTSAVNFADTSAFTNVSGIDTIKLSNLSVPAAQVLTLKAGLASTVDASALLGTNSVTVDASAMTTDMTITTGNGNDTIITGSTNGATTKYTIDAGSGDDLIKFGATTEITSANDVIHGGAGNDSLQFTTASAQTITDAFFGTHITGIETIKLANITGHTVTLSTATKAMASGLNTIDASAVTAGTATINVSGFTTAMNVIGGAGAETVTAGTGVDNYSLGLGDDALTITTLGWTSADTIAMGGGNDTLTLTDAGTVSDDLFTHVTGVETLILNDATKDKTVTLGTYAKNSGLTQIDATALVVVGTTAAKKAVIDASQMTNDMTIKGGAGDDTITMGKGNDTIIAGAGNDIIKVANAYLDSNDNVDGGAGTADIMQFVDAVTVSDSSFTNFNGIEGIKLAAFDNQSVTLGDISAAKGITIIDASVLASGNRATIDYSTMTSDVTTNVTGGSGDDTIKMQAAHLTSVDSLKLGGGSDKLILTTAATAGSDEVVDLDFTNITGLETLVLGDGNNQKVTVGAKAKLAGLTTINASALSGSNSVTVDASVATAAMSITTGSGDDIISSGTLNDTIIAGAGDDTIKFTSTTFAGDSVDGGAGTNDAILITNLMNITDTAFSGTINVEILKFSNITGESKATLGTNADLAGITLVDASTLTGVLATDKATIDVSGMTSNVEVKTGAGTDTITLGSGISKVSASSGADTIKITAENLTSADMIDGGAGIDTLLITTASTGVNAISDADTTNMTDVEIIKLSNFANQNVILGSNARLAGITTVDATLLTGTNAVSVDSSAMNSSITLKGGTGNDTFTLGNSNDTVIGGAGDDTINMASAYLTSFDKLDGGTGNDTLSISTLATITDDDFTGIQGIETLAIGNFAGQTVTLGNYASGKDITGAVVNTNVIKTIDATGALANSVTINASEATIALTINSGSGADILYATKGNNTINAGAGNDTIKIASVGFDSLDKIDGGVGTGDILEITDAATIIDTAFTNVTNIEGIKLSDFGNQSVTLGLNAQAKGIVKIDAIGLTGSNGVTIDTTAMTTADITIQTGAGNDTVIVKKAYLNGTDVLSGGTGTDKLVIADQITTLSSLDFTALTGVTGFETIALSNFAGQTLSLGNAADSEGINSVDLSLITTATVTTTVESSMEKAITVTGSDGNDIITITSVGNYGDTINSGAGNDIVSIGGGNDSINTGAGNDTITVAIAKLDGSDVIDGGIGLDTLLISDAGTIVDSAFNGIVNTEILKLAAGTTTLTVADKAFAAGIKTVDATGSTSVTLDASNFNGITVNGSNGIDTITAGTGNDILNGGAGNDIYRFKNNNLTLNDKIVDSAGDNDTLVITDAASITDAMFTGIKGIETLKLTSNVSGQVITLGAKAMAAGIKVLDLTGIDPANYTYDRTAFTGSLTILQSSPGGIYKGSAGIDVFKLSETAFDSTTAASTIMGYASSDTLEITTAASILDADFAKTTAVEILKLDVGGTATLGTAAKTAGITTIDLTGTANSTVDASVMGIATTVKLGSNTDTITTGIGADSVSVAAADLNDTINLGTGIAVDTITLTTAGTIVDTQFTNVSNVEVLKFAQGANNATLGAEAASTFTTLDATASIATDTSTYNLSAMNATVTFKGGAGNETVTLGATDQIIVAGAGNDTVKIATANLSASDNIDLGIGTDTIEITNAASVADTAFTLVKGAEVVKLDAGGSVTLDVKAQASGISTVDLTTSVGNSTIIASAKTSSTVVKLGSNTDTITTGTGADTVITTIGNLNDTIDLGSGAAIDTISLLDAGTLSSFTGITNVESLKLFNGAGNTLTLGADATFKTIDGVALTNAATVSIGSGLLQSVAINLGSGADTVTLGTNSATIIETVKVGAGNDLIKTTGVNLNATDIIDGSVGVDTLEITNISGLVDTQLSNKTGIEILNFSAGTGLFSPATLSAKASAMGVTTVNLGASGSINVSGMTRGMILNGSVGDDAFTGSNFKDTITLGSGNDIVTAGGGDDLIRVNNGDLNNADAIDGGAGTDTIEILNVAAITDTMFDAGFTLLEGIKLGDFGGQTVTLGTAAMTAGLKKVDATATTVLHGVTLDMSGTLANDVTLLGGAGDDSFKFNAADLSATDTVTAGAGSDTIKIGDAAATIADAQFTKVTGVETLTLLGTGAQAVTVGNLAKTAGITKIDMSASTAASSITNAMTTDSTMTMIGGSGNDTFTMKNIHLTSTDTITGNGGTDSMVFSDAATVLDADLTHVSGVEKIVLGDFAAQSITLGTLATGAGITTVDGSAIVTATNALTVDTTAMGGATLTLKGGAGDDIFKLKSADFTSADAIVAAGGANTIVFGDAASVVDSDFTAVSGVGTLKVSNFSGQNLALGEIARVEGITKVDATAVSGANTVVVDVSGMTSDATLSVLGGGATTLKAKTAHVTTADTFTGGAGIDTIEFADAATVVDSMFDTSYTRLDVIKLGDFTGQSVTLGVNAMNAGLKKVDATASTYSVTLDARGTVTNNITLLGGSGADTFKANLADISATDVIAGNGGSDTLQIANATATVTDALFTKITGVEILQLAGIGAQTVSIGSVANTAGLTTIDAHLSSSASITNAMVTDTTMTMIGGAGNDTFTMKNIHLTNADTITGNAGTADTIVFSDAATVIDTDFAHVTGVEAIKLGNFSGQSLALGNAASTAGVVKVDASAVTTTTNTILVDISGMSTNATFTVIGGGAATLKVNNGHLTSADTFTGSAGVDTIQIADAATVVDSMFGTNFTLLDGIKLGDFGSQSVTLGTNAMTAGLKKVDASLTTASNGVAMDVRGTTINNVTLIGGAGADTFTFNVADFSATDTLTGGLGSDTLVLGTAATALTQTDAQFTKVTGLETLKLGDFASQVVTLGTLATTAGIRTVDGSLLTGTNAVTIDTLSMTAAALLLKGGAASDTFKLKSAFFDSLDSVVGGAGTADTIIFSDVATVIDTDFALSSGVEVLQLANFGTQSITLGTAATAAGINKVDGSVLSGTNAVSMNVSGMGASVLTLIGGAGNDTFTLKAADFTAADTITAAGGIADKIVFSDAATVIDADFTLVSGVESIKLGNFAGQNITVGTLGVAAGIRTVDGSLSASGVTYDLSGTTTNDMAVLGGAGDDSFKFNAADLSATDTVTAGAGSDTIKIGDAAATIADAQFTKVTGVETLTLLGTGAQAVTVGNLAKTAGITKIDMSASTAASSITNAMTTDSTMTMIGGSGNDTFTMKNIHLTSTDTITGNGGTDSMVFSDAATVLDADLTHVSGVEKIVLGDFAAQSITLGTLAFSAGINTVDGHALTGTNSVIINAKAMDDGISSRAITMTGGAGADKFYSSLGNDILTGNGGADIFVYANAPTNGNDTISDFTDASDKIAITVTGKVAGTAIAVGDIDTYATIASANAGADTLITLASGDTITLTGVTSSNITAADFIYG